MTTQRNRSIVLWLAALALLWGMLGPSLASSLAPHPDPTWSEVCTSAGAVGDELVHPGMHCPACVTQYDLAVVFHPPGSLALRDAPLERILRRNGHALPPAAAIRTAHRSRAPPPAA